MDGRKVGPMLPIDGGRYSGGSKGLIWATFQPASSELGIDCSGCQAASALNLEHH